MTRHKVLREGGMGKYEIIAEPPMTRREKIEASIGSDWCIGETIRTLIWDELHALWAVVDAAKVYTDGGNHPALFNSVDAYYEGQGGDDE